MNIARESSSLALTDADAFDVSSGKHVVSVSKSHGSESREFCVPG